MPDRAEAAFEAWKGTMDPLTAAHHSTPEARAAYLAAYTAGAEQMKVDADQLWADFQQGVEDRWVAHLANLRALQALDAQGAGAGQEQGAGGPSGSNEPGSVATKEPSPRRPLDLESAPAPPSTPAAADYAYRPAQGPAPEVPFDDSRTLIGGDHAVKWMEGPAPEGECKTCGGDGRQLSGKALYMRNWVPCSECPAGARLQAIDDGPACAPAPTEGEPEALFALKSYLELDTKSLSLLRSEAQSIVIAWEADLTSRRWWRYRAEQFEKQLNEVGKELAVAREQANILRSALRGD